MRGTRLNCWRTATATTCAICCLYLISQASHLQLATCTSIEQARQRLKERQTTLEPQRPTSGTSLDVVGLDPVEYLRRFGYLSEDVLSAEPGSSNKEMAKAVGRFQEFVGIEKTGAIDDPTTKSMMRSRCGNRDTLFPELDEDGKPQGGEDGGEPAEDSQGDGSLEDGEKQQQAATAKWLTKTGQLTYRIVTYPSRLNKRRPEVDDVFRRAFDAWEAVVPIKFERRTTGDAHFDINFIAGEHYCSAGPLHQGVGDTPILAHAFGPPKAGTPTTGAAGAPEDTFEGDIHFNDHIMWTIDGPNAAKTGQSLLAAAIHQIGHALGLEHSKVASAKMFPMASNLVKLHESDKINIQKIYRPKRRQDNFFVFDKRRLPDGSRDLFRKSNMGSLDECADLAQNRRANVTVWDRNKHTCVIKSTTQDRDRFTLYTGAGKRLEGYDVHSQDLDSTELESDVSQWLGSRNCDIILKMEEWPVPGKRGYKCKTLKEDDCCTMLFRLGKDRSHPDLLAEKSKVKKQD